MDLLPPTPSGTIVATAARIRAARAIAMLADLAQIVVMPAFSLDVGVGIALSYLLGWHWVFLPSFLSELIPIWDLVPTWTAAVWYVTSGALPPGEGPPGPPSARVQPPSPPPALKG